MHPFLSFFYTRWLIFLSGLNFIHYYSNTIAHRRYNQTPKIIIIIISNLLSWRWRTSSHHHRFVIASPSHRHRITMQSSRHHRIIIASSQRHHRIMCATPHVSLSRRHRVVIAPSSHHHRVIIASSSHHKRMRASDVIQSLLQR